MNVTLTKMAEFLIGLGLFFVGVAVVALWRAPDAAVRVHATTPATSLGVLLVALGVGWRLGFSDWTGLKAILIWFFLILSSPLTAHWLFQMIRKWRVPLKNVTLADCPQWDLSIKKDSRDSLS